MSRKLTSFRTAACVAPQTTCNYVVWIPSILTSPFVVERTTLPFSEIESKTIAVRGIMYSIPVKRKAQGSWSCTLGESILMSSIYQSLWKQHVELSTDNIVNKLFTVSYKDIFIYVTDGVTGTTPIMGCVLRDCYLERILPISLDASGATTPMKIELTFRYNDIGNPIEIMEDMMGSTNDIANPLLLQAAVVANTVAAWSTNKITETTRDVITGKKGFDDLAETLKRFTGGVKDSVKNKFEDFL